MYKILFFSLLLFANNIFAASVAVPTITNSISAGTTFKFTVTLSGKLLTGYKVKIDLKNGKGLVAMTCSGMTCTLSSNTLPKDVNSVPYKVGIYDSKGVLQGITMDGTLVISSVANSAYTKISNSGAELPDTAKLGSGANDWACTKDNKTDLIWEVKTLKGGLRNMDNEYTNYFLDEIGYGTSNNADVFVSAVNQQTLCGKSDWHLPVKSELKTLVFCSDGKYDADGSCTYWKEVTKPTINTVYFPNTKDEWYWSSSPYAYSSSYAWGVYFGYGGSGSDDKSDVNFIRLVR
jgi:hypothetical protein